MYITLVLVAMLSIFSLTVSWVSENGYKEVLNKGIIDPVTSTFKDKTKISYIVQSEHEDKEEDGESIALSLIRTCRLVEIKAHGEGCSTDDPAIAWKFVGALGSKGRLDNALLGATSSVFSCAGDTRTRYARYLLRQTITLREVSDKKIGYDLRDVKNLTRRHDPCGYIGIISGI